MQPHNSRLAVKLVALGGSPAQWLTPLSDALGRMVGWRCSILPEMPDLGFAFLNARSQFYSTAILARLQEQYCGNRRAGRRAAVLGVADVDLALPIFTFVFGEAHNGGPCAVISGHRLRQEFYGLPPDPVLFEERLVKMAIHELGHTLGLRHCAGYRCVMATSYSIERLDLKSTEFCRSCAKQLDQGA